MKSELIVRRLRASAAEQRSGAPDGATTPLADELDEAADIIEMLCPSCDAADIVGRLRRCRASMLGTDDEDTFWACHDAASEIMSLRAEVMRLRRKS